MTVRLGNGLISLIIIYALLVITIFFFPFNVIRIILGIPLLILSPGYTLLAALFTKKGEMNGLTRIALSFALSLVVVPLVGLVLNYTPWGIRLETTIYAIGSFILVTSIIAWLRQRKLARHERFAIEFKLRMPGRGKGAWDRALTIIMVVVIIGTLGTLGKIIASPKLGEAFTEFNFIGQDLTTNYTTELKVGEQGRAILRIVNHEGKEVSYKVDVVVNGKKGPEFGPVLLADRGQWEGEISFTPELTGDKQKVEFFLYRDDEVKPYLGPLYLWVNVID